MTNITVVGVRSVQLGIREESAHFYRTPVRPLTSLQHLNINQFPVAGRLFNHFFY